MDDYAYCHSRPERRVKRSSSPQSEREDAQWQVQNGPCDHAWRVRPRACAAQYVQEPVDEHDRAERHDEPRPFGFRDRQYGPDNENGCRNAVHDDEPSLVDWGPDNAGRPTGKSFAAPPFLAEMGKVARREHQPPPVHASRSVRHNVLDDHALVRAAL